MSDADVKQYVAVDWETLKKILIWPNPIFEPSYDTLLDVHDYVYDEDELGEN